jgi:hypothetical protein
MFMYKGNLTRESDALASNSHQTHYAQTASLSCSLQMLIQK